MREPRPLAIFTVFFFIFSFSAATSWADQLVGNGNAAVELPQTGQTTCYDANGAVIMCIGGTGQDGEIRAGMPWPNPRFENKGDGTVTDKLTGLIWTENANAPGPVSCPTGTPMNWQAALDYLKCLNNNSYLNQNDWRLPNINEISSFMNVVRQIFPRG